MNEKTISLEKWNAATTEQRREWLRQGVLTDRMPEPATYREPPMMGGPSNSYGDPERSDCPGF